MMKKNVYAMFTFSAPVLSWTFATESGCMVFEKAGQGVWCSYLVSLLNKSWPHSLQTYLPDQNLLRYFIPIYTLWQISVSFNKT